ADRELGSGARAGRDARRARPRDGTPHTSRARDHGHEVLRADVAVGDRAPPRYQPDARVALAACRPGAAPEIRAARKRELSGRAPVALLEGEAPRDPFVVFQRWCREGGEAGAPQQGAVTRAT